MKYMSKNNFKINRAKYNTQRAINSYNYALTNHFMLDGLYPEVPSLREHIWFEKCFTKRFNGTHKTILNFLPKDTFNIILKYLRMTRKERRLNPDIKKIYMLSMRLASKRMEIAKRKIALGEQVNFDSQNNYIGD